MLHINIFHIINKQIYNPNKNLTTNVTDLTIKNKYHVSYHFLDSQLMKTSDD